MKIINCWFGVNPEPFIVSLPNLKRSEAGSQKTAGSIGSEVRTQRLSLSHSLRFSLIFYFLLLNSYFLLPASAWADQIDTLRPAVDGGPEEWFDSPVVDSSYKNIDDVVIDLDTTHLYTGNISKKHAWLANDFSTSNTIDSVRVVVKARSTATSGTPTLKFGRKYYAGEGLWGDCEYGGGMKTVNLTLTYDSNWTQTWAVDPCDNGAWTTAKLNDDLLNWTFASTTAMGALSDSFGLISPQNPYSWNVGANYVSCTKFTSGSGTSGTLNAIRLYVTDQSLGGNVKMGIYSDSSGWPHKKIWADTTGQATVNGWNTVSASGNISSSTDYWLCYRYATYACSTRIDTPYVANSHRSKSLAYTTAWPDSFAPSWTYNKAEKYQLKAVLGVPPQDRVTQSYIVVYSHAVGAVVKRKSGLVQDEDNKGVIEGGIAR